MHLGDAIYLQPASKMSITFSTPSGARFLKISAAILPWFNTSRVYIWHIYKWMHINIYITKYLPSWDEEYPICRDRALINTKSLRPFYIIHIFTATNVKRRILFLYIKQNCIFPANMLLLHGNHNSEKWLQLNLIVYRHKMKLRNTCIIVAPFYMILHNSSVHWWTPS